MAGLAKGPGFSLTSGLAYYNTPGYWGGAAGLIDPEYYAKFGANFQTGSYWLNGKEYLSAATLPGWAFTGGTTTNGANRYAEDTSGNLVAFASGLPRITNKGFLVEEARTNLFLNSLTPATQNVTLSATGNYTITVWGTGSVTVAAGTATITNAGSVTAGSPRTINCTATGTISVTVTGSPTGVNVEAGAFGTSLISTAGAAATRAADNPSVTGLGSILAMPVTLVAWADLPAADGIQRFLATLTDGTANNVAAVRRGTNNAAQVRVQAGGVNVAAFDIGSPAAGARVFKMSGRYRSSTAAGASDGGSVTSNAVSAAPSGLNRLLFGVDQSSGSYINGYIQKVLIAGDSTDAQLVDYTR